MAKTSVWRGKYNSIAEYYASKYDPEFYYFDEYQVEIDPDETEEEKNNYNEERQKEEILKCTESFPYFCQKYVKILHPMEGLVPFILFKYQSKCIDEYKAFRFNIISKFRQGGLTTVTLIYGLWKCLFELNQQIMTLSRTDRDAVVTGYLVDRAVENLPAWLKPEKEGKWNDHLKQFPDTGGNFQFYSPEAARGKSITFLIIDEAAFIPDMHDHWKAMWPTLSNGGSCVLVSTVNGIGNWYEETYSAAKEGKNKFHIIDLDYWEHPEYSEKNNPDWVSEQKAQMGERGFLQEVLRSFLGSGETYIPSDKLASLDQALRDIYPSKKIFSQFANKNSTCEDDDVDDAQKGALWIWKEPVEGQEYVIGVDCAEGIGNDGDNSCVQIINMTTLEQVAEFYSNNISPHDLSSLVNEMGILYNNALIIVEDMASGGIVLNQLLMDFSYENLFYLAKNGKTNKPGIKMTAANRPVILQGFQSRIINDNLKIKSRRLLREMKTFEFNNNTKKAEAAKGKHDDAIIAISLALYARDQSVRDIPLGMVVSENGLKSSKAANIKEELRKGLRDSIIDKIKIREKSKKDFDNDLIISLYRKRDSLLKEFGW